MSVFYPAAAWCPACLRPSGGGWIWRRPFLAAGSTRNAGEFAYPESGVLELILILTF
jgi:hypothetical protein